MITPEKGMPEILHSLFTYVLFPFGAVVVLWFYFRFFKRLRTFRQIKLSSGLTLEKGKEVLNRSASYRYRYENPQSWRRYKASPKFIVTIDLPLEGMFLIQKTQGYFSFVYQLFGLKKAQTGNQEFDSRYFFSATNPSLQLLLQDLVRQKAIQNLDALGCRLIHADGSVLEGIWSPFHPPSGFGQGDIEKAAGYLREVGRGLPGLSGQVLNRKKSVSLVQQASAYRAAGILVPFFLVSLLCSIISLMLLFFI